MLIPNKLFLTKGTGQHREKLGSFEMALRNAGIAPYNLVEVSSIIPPNCRIISKEEGLRLLNPGQITFCVLAKQQTDEYNRLLAASVGLAIPGDSNLHGYLSEHHSFGETEETAGNYSEYLAIDMLGSTLGLEINIDSARGNNNQSWKLSGKIFKTQNITAATVNKEGIWTTVVAAAVFADFE